MRGADKLRCIKGRFHKQTKPANESTLVASLKMKSLVFVTDVCHRPIKNVWSSHCTMVNDQSMTDQLKLTYLIKQSSDRPNNNIRHVKYFAQKPRRPIDLSVTLDVQGFIFIVRSPRNILSAHWTVISESQ